VEAVVADLEILYDPITVGITGLDNIKTDSKFAVTQPIDTSLTLSVPDTVKTDTKLTISIPDTIKTDAKGALDTKSAIDTKSSIDTKSAIDLQPVVLDQCFKLSLGALPPTLVCLPSHQRIGLTLFGVEVFGLTYEGESKVVVSDLPKPPHIINVSAPKVVQKPAADCAAEVEPPPHPAEPPRKSPPFVVRLGG
jgi:hypothetical protein